MTEFAELEIEIERRGAGTFAAELRLTTPKNEADQRAECESFAIAFDELRQHAGDGAVDTGDGPAYGRRLGQDFFSLPLVHKCWTDTLSGGPALRLRLSMPPYDAELQGLRWEALADPDPAAPHFMSERVLFSRYIQSEDWRPVPPRAKGDLRALVVVANPSGLDTARFAPIDVAAEIARVRNGMVGINQNQIDVLGELDRATMQNIRARLRTGPDILYLVCHGLLQDGKSWLWLEDEAGNAAQLDGADLISWLQEPKQPPRLVVLVSCQSAGTGAASSPGAVSESDANALAALGPRLGEAGVPAVLAMHGSVDMATMASFLPVFFAELQKDGMVDRAVAVARTSVSDHPDAWMPVLYMRLRTGNLWGLSIDDYEGWPALLNHIKSGECVPVLGPGMTESLIGPRRDIARQWARDYGYPMAEYAAGDLPQVAQYVQIHQNDRAILLKELSDSVRDQFLQQLGNDAPEALRAEDVPIEPLLLELAKRRWPSGPDAPLSTEPHWVLAQRPFQIFVTATPDRLLFEALGAVGKQPREELFQWNEKGSWPALIRDTEPSYEPTQENPLVYYLFGRHDVPHSLVITEDDYFDYLIGFGKFYHAKDDIRLFELINTKLTEWSLLFLGFEMDGWDSRVLFRSIMGPHRATLAGDYDVARAGVQLDLSEDRIQKLDRAREYLRDYFSKANIHLYWGSVEDFARDLQQRSTGSP